MNITADGNVPLTFDLFDGNRTDDTTHIPNWNALREFLEEEDFIYIADCKLCSRKNLNHIHEHGGIFITIVPKNRSEVKGFYEFLKTNPIKWEYACETPNSRKKSDAIIYKTCEGEKSKTGYRIIWVHSSAKELQDKRRRENKIANLFRPRSFDRVENKTAYTVTLTVTDNDGETAQTTATIEVLPDTTSPDVVRGGRVK